MTSGHGEAIHAHSWRVPAWGEIPRLVHGFLGRAYALPEGSFTLEAIRAKLLAAGEKPHAVFAVRQVHGGRVFVPTAAGSAAADWDGHVLPAALPEADALVSTAVGAILTIRTADCVPILLVAPEARAVAAVHAGWKGVLDGIIQNALATLERDAGARPAEVRAALGPAIGGCCYEFGAEHLPRFITTFGSSIARAWRPGTAKRVQLDVRYLARIALEAAGVSSGAISVIGPCTAEHHAELHSYRRDGARAGRQLSYIGWRDA
jgi:YfiH family protein